jgi:hypothetical protein
MRYPANHVLGAQRNGVNHVSMNYGRDVAGGPVRGTNYPVYSDALLDWYQSTGMRSVRLMFTWEGVQSSLGGPVPAAGANYANYWADLTGVVTRLLARGSYVTLAPWQFNPAVGPADAMGNHPGDTDVVYKGGAFSATDFADFWGKFAAAVNAVTGSDLRVSFDLINEPHSRAETGNTPGVVGVEIADWFARAQAAVTAIRAAGAANTVFVPGMQFTSAKEFVNNGSAAAFAGLTPQNDLAVTVHCYSGIGSTSATVLRDSCTAVVDWARSQGTKVQIGEIALDAGPNGTATSASSFAMAQQQWADWRAFCLENDDVLIGWNWWANSTGTWWNAGDSTGGNHWALSTNDGATQTVYANLIANSLRVPRLAVRDTLTDPADQPDLGAATAWESPDIWPRQSADGALAGQSIIGGQPAVVYVRVTNKGLGDYPATGTDVVKVFWAKASSGLGWPGPWDGTFPMLGAPVAPAFPIGAVPAGQELVLPVPWQSPPDPSRYPGNDGHFCLLAVVTKAAGDPFDGFSGTNLNLNVLTLSHVAWRNIHIDPGVHADLGEMVIANPHSFEIHVEVAFQGLDEHGDPVDQDGDLITLIPRRHALERLHDLGTSLTEVGGGRFRLAEPTRGIASLGLAAEEQLPFALEVAAQEAPTAVAAVRATQYALERGERVPVGGQTFVLAGARQREDGSFSVQTVRS